MAKRPKSNRRPLSFRQSWKPQLLAVRFDFVAVNDLRLQVQGSRLFGDGIPQVHVSSLGYPTAVLIEDVSPVSTNITLTYGGAVLPGMEISLEPYDGALRTAQGGYLAPFFDIVPT